MKSSAVVVSSSDLHILDLDYVLYRVAQGKLGGLAFESKERKVTDFKGNVMVFPEQAYYTLGTQTNRARAVTETILSIIEGRPVSNRVN